MQKIRSRFNQSRGRPILRYPVHKIGIKLQGLIGRVQGNIIKLLSARRIRLIELNIMYAAQQHARSSHLERSYVCVSSRNK